jgi:hypothetical protein
VTTRLSSRPSSGGPARNTRSRIVSTPGLARSSVTRKCGVSSECRRSLSRAAVCAADPAARRAYSAAAIAASAAATATTNKAMFTAANRSRAARPLPVTAPAESHMPQVIQMPAVARSSFFLEPSITLSCANR